MRTREFSRDSLRRKVTCISNKLQQTLSIQDAEVLSSTASTPDRTTARSPRTQNNDYATTPAEAAKSVVATALQTQPQPRGKFLMHDLSEVNWDMEVNWDQVLGGVKTTASKY